MNLSSGQKGLIYEITSGVIRWKIYLDWVTSRYAKSKVKRDIRYLLWISLYQICFMKKGYYHVVNETVDYVKKQKGRTTADFVNAVLRGFTREKAPPLQTLPFLSDLSEAPSSKRLSVTHSFPEWLVARWSTRFGEDKTERLLTLLNTVPEFGLRVNLKKTTTSEVMRRLDAKGITARKGKFLESALYVNKLAQILGDELFQSGIVHIQDEASQLLGWSFEVRPGDYILDACAGFGTKSRQIAELWDDPYIVSMDRDFRKLVRVQSGTMPVHGDAMRSPFREEIFDIVIVDAPCSSLGVIRKHPEVKWRRKESDITAFSDIQARLIETLWDNLKTGGCMLYSVCSFEPEETLGVIEGFKEKRKFVLENPLPFLFNKDYFLSLPHETGMDGFFIAKLRKL